MKQKVINSICAQSPPEYRLALDAAFSWCSPFAPIRVLCQSPALEAEMNQRLDAPAAPPWRSLLWIEPQTSDWLDVLSTFARSEDHPSHLAMILSLFPAKHLPSRLASTDSSLGVQRWGIQRLRRALRRQGFHQQAWFGIHTGQSVLLFFLAERARQLGAFALGDRLEFTARLHYTKPLAKTWLATCALGMASQE